MDYIIAAVIKALINVFTDLSMKVFAEVMLKKGIRIRAEKNEEAINNGDAQLSQGNLEGWLNELNNEK